MAGQSYELDPLDVDVLRGIVEKLTAKKINFDKAFESLTKENDLYERYMDRVANAVGLMNRAGYRPNFVTNQLEPIPPAPTPKPPVKAPDSDLPSPPIPVNAPML